eukprot:641099-Amphidinium_carterae.1
MLPLPGLLAGKGSIFAAAGAAWVQGFGESTTSSRNVLGLCHWFFLCSSTVVLRGLGSLVVPLGLLRVGASLDWSSETVGFY